jgi:hypothetical protein
MGKVLTTIVLEFGSTTLSSSDYTCFIEPDETRNIVKDGDEDKEKTSFEPGEDYYFLVKCVGKARVTRIECTHGSIVSLGVVPLIRTNDLLFVEYNSKDNKPSLSYPPNGSVSAEWIGNVGGSLKVDSSDQTVDISSGQIPCYCKASYPVTFNSYRLMHSALNFDSYDIYIVVYLEEIP